MTLMSKIVFNLSSHYATLKTLLTKAMAVYVIHGDCMTFELKSNKRNGLLVKVVVVVQQASGSRNNSINMLHQA